jgi:surface protein
MENRVVVETPVQGVFTRLGLLFRKFGDVYASEGDVGFDLQDAVQDIRDACAAGSLPDLEMDVFDIMVEDMIAHARQQVQCGDYDGRLTECDLTVILLYTCEFPDANSLYAVMNKKLNIPDRNLVKPFVKYIWLLLRALAKCPASQYRTVYRGIKNADLTKHYPNNHEFEWHQFSSCSCSLEVQNHFTGQAGVRTLFVIELTSSRGRDVGVYSALQREMEVLLPPNTKFRVMSTFAAGGGLNMIQVVEIPPTDPVVVFRDNFDATLLPPSPVQPAEVAVSTATVLKMPTPPAVSVSVTLPSALTTAAGNALTTSSIPSHGSSMVPAVVPVVVPIASPSVKSPVGGNTSATQPTTHQSSLPDVALLSVTALSSGMTLNQPFTNASLKGAVKLWCENKSAAAANFGDISTWNTSQVTSMRELFKHRKDFNDTIGNWDVSNVTDMLWMFGYAASFNQSLDSWNVSKVTTMWGMFWHASSFNQPLNSWDVRNVTQMDYMFSYARSFNQPLHSWDVKSVTHMYCMFSHAVCFNQPLDAWNVSSVVHMGWMFYGAAAFNQSLDNWVYNKNVDRRDMLKDTAVITR